MQSGHSYLQLQLCNVILYGCHFCAGSPARSGGDVYHSLRQQVSEGASASTCAQRCSSCSMVAKTSITENSACIDCKLFDLVKLARKWAPQSARVTLRACGWSPHSFFLP